MDIDHKEFTRSKRDKKTRPSHNNKTTPLKNAHKSKINSRCVSYNEDKNRGWRRIKDRHENHSKRQKTREELLRDDDFKANETRALSKTTWSAKHRSKAYREKCNKRQRIRDEKQKFRDENFIVIVNPIKKCYSCEKQWDDSQEECCSDTSWFFANGKTQCTICGFIMLGYRKYQDCKCLKEKYPGYPGHYWYW